MTAHAIALCEEYDAASEAYKQAEARKTAATTELLTLIGDAEKAAAGPFNISAPTVAGCHVEFDRKPYRLVRITKPKPKKPKAKLLS